MAKPSSTKTLYKTIVDILKIDPINEGRILEKKVTDILLPNNVLDLETESARNQALVKVNNLYTVYIKRSKKFWTYYQLYAFFKGMETGTKEFSAYVKGSDKELNRIKTYQSRLLK